jgi:hypothetical protein
MGSPPYAGQCMNQAFSDDGREGDDGHESEGGDD